MYELPEYRGKSDKEYLDSIKCWLEMKVKKSDFDNIDIIDKILNLPNVVFTGDVIKMIEAIKDELQEEIGKE